jgi:hypothetical protein
MKLRTVVFVLALAPTSVMAADSIPNGWIKAGSNPGEYEVGIDSSTHHGGRASGYVKAITKDLHGFGTLMQMAEPLRAMARLLARQAAREFLARLEISDKAPRKETS